MRWWRWFAACLSYTHTRLHLNGLKNIPLNRLMNAINSINETGLVTNSNDLAFKRKEWDWENATLFAEKTCFISILLFLSVFSFSAAIAKANATFLLSHFNSNVYSTGTLDSGWVERWCAYCRTYRCYMRAKNNSNRHILMAIHETDLRYWFN